MAVAEKGRFIRTVENKKMYSDVKIHTTPLSTSEMKGIVKNTLHHHPNNDNNNNNNNNNDDGGDSNNDSNNNKNKDHLIISLRKELCRVQKQKVDLIRAMKILKQREDEYLLLIWKQESKLHWIAQRQRWQPAITNMIYASKTTTPIPENYRIWCQTDGSCVIYTIEYFNPSPLIIASFLPLVSSLNKTLHKNNSNNSNLKEEPVHIQMMMFDLLKTEEIIIDKDYIKLAADSFMILGTVLPSQFLWDVCVETDNKILTILNEETTLVKARQLFSQWSTQWDFALLLCRDLLLNYFGVALWQSFNTETISNKNNQLNQVTQQNQGRDKAISWTGITDIWAEVTSAYRNRIEQYIKYVPNNLKNIIQTKKNHYISPHQSCLQKPTSRSLVTLISESDSGSDSDSDSDSE